MTRRCRHLVAGPGHRICRNDRVSQRRLYLRRPELANIDEVDGLSCASPRCHSRAECRVCHKCLPGTWGTRLPRTLSLRRDRHRVAGGRLDPAGPRRQLGLGHELAGSHAVSRFSSRNADRPRLPGIRDPGTELLATLSGTWLPGSVCPKRFEGDLRSDRVSGEAWLT